MRPLIPFLGLIAGTVTETGNPEFTVQLRASANTTTATARAVRGSVGTPTVDEAWMVIDELKLQELKMGSSCRIGLEVEHTATGPHEIDLYTTTPAAIDIDVRGTSYCGLRVDFGTADGVVDAPTELDGHSVLLAGTTADGVPFAVRSQGGFRVELRSEARAFTIDSSTNQLLLAFDLDTWLAGMDFTTADVDADGTIYVDESNNPDLLDTFEENVESAMALHSDVAGDGTLDSGDSLLAD